jgi:hypothetical protein
VHYLIGFQRLGYDVYYVEAHGTTPRNFFDTDADDGWTKAASFIAGVMHRFDLDDHWVYHAIHGTGQCYGMSQNQLNELYRSADLIINLHGGTIPLPEHYATGRLIYLETDPVQIQIQVYDKQQHAIDLLAPHRAFFTFGENYGCPECKLPVFDRFPFKPTRQPIVFDFWNPHADGVLHPFTTIGNWKQLHRRVTFQGEVFHWSKHFEFLKFIDLPARTGQPFELAMSSCGESDRQMLEGRGWRVRAAMDFSMDVDAYRDYIASSRGEFTVAKEQNVRFRTGWFSDRSATYLAAGRPVITQETGFSNILPTGKGLFSFSTLDEIVAAVEAIAADYDTHCRTASTLAREFFNYDVVLKRLVDDVGL